MNNITQLILVSVLLLGSVVVNADVNGNTTTIVDPWIVQERYDMYMTILASTHVPRLFGQDNLGNLLWGLPIQMEWQNRTGRLETAPSQNGLRINEYSWWADMNYYLSVIPYLSAMRKGLVPAISIRPPVVYKTNQLCLTYETCNANVMSKWDKYFDAIIALQANTSTLDTDRLLKIMWDAHTASIGYAVKQFSANLAKLNVREAEFGNGWGHFVEILDIVGFNTNYTQVSMLGVNLPNRMLRTTDIPPFIPDMTKPMNNVALSMISINDLTKIPFAWPTFLELLRAVELIPGCHNLILSEINDYLINPVGTIIDVLEGIMTFCKSN
ncbi:hypothetical protein SAMD00019534_022720, partial [Acytostelium subglobosum LB1]|uniref:hypothetical protein n=1 Tax=Acytostelium subglobosum LB1 TaxID=1410327 RepID=UPI0006447B02